MHSWLHVYQKSSLIPRMQREKLCNNILLNETLLMKKQKTASVFVN